MKKDENKNKDKYLYKCKSYVDVDEYLKMCKYFPIHSYIPFLIRGFLVNLIVTLFVLLLTRDWYITLLFFIILQIIIAIYCKRAQMDMLRKLYINEKGEKKDIFTRLFYKDYMLSKIDNNVIEFKYDTIKEMIETNTNIYLLIDKTSQVIIIQKENCSSKLIDFLRDKLNNLDKSKSQSHSMINLFLFSLFILTLLTVPIAMHTYNLLSKAKFLGDNPFWVLLLFLIIPFSSIVLGIYYNNKGVTGITVVGTITYGFIVFFLLLLFSIGLIFP